MSRNRAQVRCPCQNAQSCNISQSDFSDALAGFGSAIAGTIPLAHVNKNAEVMHEQSVPFLLPNQMGYAGEYHGFGPANGSSRRSAEHVFHTDSPFFPNEFPVNPSPDHRSGSPESSKSSGSSSRTSEKRYADSDRETEEIFIEQPREHGYDAIDGEYPTKTSVG